MNRKLSVDQQVFLLKKRCQLDRNFIDVIGVFKQQFPGAQPPSRQAFYKLNMSLKRQVQ